LNEPAGWKHSIFRKTDLSVDSPIDRDSKTGVSICKFIFLSLISPLSKT